MQEHKRLQKIPLFFADQLGVQVHPLHPPGYAYALVQTRSDTLGVTVLGRLDYLDFRFRNCP